MLRDASGHFTHRPVDVEALRRAAEARAQLLRAERDATPPAGGDAAELVRRVEGLLRWHAG